MAETHTIKSMMEETRKFDPPHALSEKAWIKNFSDYKKMYDRSINDPEGFWSEMAGSFVWYKKWDKVRSFDFKGKIDIKFFEGAETNMSVNCLDRHVDAGRGDRRAIIWEGNDPKATRTYTYKELLGKVCKFANVLKKNGVKRGDRVSIYMPMIPELPIAMLACARIGAIHSIVFGGFSAEALRDRIIDSGCTFLVTTDGSYRGTKAIPLKTGADEAMRMCEEAGNPVRTCIVYKHTGAPTEMKAGRDIWWHDAMADVSSTCEAERMNAEDPLFILYTSGSTGKPKGVLHTTGGYMVFAATTFKYIFDYHDEDIFWCTADIGWVTGHTYIVYGPLATGATSLMFEGVPTYPDAGRFWEVCAKHGVTIFYTAPTAIRSLMREGEEWTKKHDLSKLRVLGSVGEPINPEAWIWYYKNIGHEKAPIMDTWWQTETGGILISPLPGAIATKPGSATFPFFGVKPKVVRENGTQCGPNEGGYLVIEEPWPGMMRTVYNHHERFRETYFTMFPGVYFTGDGARVDEEGYYWLMGRVDDVINVSGHRIGTAEVESALVSNFLVAEAAVVGFPHEIKGQGLYAYVTLKSGNKPSDDVKKTLIAHVRKEIGPIATPDKIHFTDALPKTRSGKIMRRILRKIAEGDISNLGDTSTLADPGVVNALVEARQ
ncbi:MAG: acetate--CoA ligase [Pseudomonadota bacterium]